MVSSRIPFRIKPMSSKCRVKSNNQSCAVVGTVSGFSANLVCEHNFTAFLNGQIKFQQS